MFVTVDHKYHMIHNYAPNVSNLYTKCHLTNSNISLLIDLKLRVTYSEHFTYLQHFQHNIHTMDFIPDDPQISYIQARDNIVSTGSM